MKEGIDIIDNYRDLPIGTYMDIQAACKDESLDELGKQVRIISLLANASEDDILNLPIADYKRLVAKSRFLEAPSPDSPGRIAKEYRIGGFTLVPTSDFRKITTAQYIDFQTFSAQGEDKYVEILSCFLVPKGHKYGDGYDTMEVQDAIRQNVSVAETLSMAAFFLTRYVRLIRYSLTYSRRLLQRMKESPEKGAMKERIAQAEALLTNGDGWQEWIRSATLFVSRGRQSGKSRPLSS